MEPEITTEETPAGDVSLHTILKAIQNQGDINSKLRQELSELKNEVHGSSLTVQSQVKKLKVEQEYKWKYESNRIQFLLNTEIQEDLNQVIWALDNTKIEYARDTVNEVIDKVKKRNKHIKIADSSEAGWETVKQYETNPVASDTDDENKINRAENRALKKKKLKSSKKLPSKSSTASYNAQVPPQFLPNFPANKQQLPFREPQQSWYTGFPLYSNTPSTSGLQRKFQQGACYSCGSMQHWRNRCPFNPKADTRPKAE